MVLEQKRAVMKINKKGKNLILLLSSLLFLLTGGLIYLFFRQHSLLMFSWLRFINLEQYFQIKNFNHESQFLCFCVYSLPNMLWAISAYMLFGIVLQAERKLFYIYSSGFCFVNVLAEIFQKFQIISGTFDFMDLLVLLISYGMGVLIYEFIIKEKLKNEIQQNKSR